MASKGKSIERLTGELLVEQAREYLKDEYEEAYSNSDITKVHFLDTVVRDCRVHGYVEGLAMHGFMA